MAYGTSSIKWMTAVHETWQNRQARQDHSGCRRKQVFVMLFGVSPLPCCQGSPSISHASDTSWPWAALCKPVVVAMDGNIFSVFWVSGFYFSPPATLVRGREKGAVSSPWNQGEWAATSDSRQVLCFGSRPAQLLQDCSSPQILSRCLSCQPAAQQRCLVNLCVFLFWVTWCEVKCQFVWLVCRYRWASPVISYWK